MRTTGASVLVSLISLILQTGVMAQQISIPRVEQMPNLPAPYEMRDWRKVAIGYDDFVFDLTKTGQYLPLVWINENTVNYPEHDSFGLETVVGTPRYRSGETINALPALVGASLVGIDKSDQNGHNWVLMSEEYFNRRPEENVYLNGPTASSGSDWWYETMPNVFFYQLYDLYPGIGDFDFQFTTIADQFLEAVVTMGGSASPWRVPNMDYRAWFFSTMKPLRTGVKEPEAAGAIAWLLYNAYVETADDRYRLGAEWAMEFLNGRTSNPSYELQLPYGVYAATRMNAELGTAYDVEKMVNWCFDVGPLREWGSILGTWGGYDVHGLIGENSTNDYAFLMNGFQQAGALVPMTRYDDRFARAIGKWVLNLANASRLFYPKYLPAANQDSEEWAFQYDPESYIGHEAIRQTAFGNSPYATGDAIAGGWGRTNLVLYGSSHVGMLGGLLDTTNVEGILRLDLLKTDFFAGPAFPTWLYFNPHQEARDVIIELDTGTFDLYDAVANEFVAQGVAGSVTVAMPADQARMIVQTPSGGVQSFAGNQMLIDGVVVDFNAGTPVENRPPRIKAIDAAPRSVFQGGSASVFCTAEDLDGDSLSFGWQASAGQFSGQGATATWTPPVAEGEYEITCHVDDGRGGAADASTMLSVFSNHVPAIESLSADPSITSDDGSSTVTCQASDEDGDPLTYSWSANGGSVTGSGPAVTWSAPGSPGYYVVHCTVEDGEGASASDSVGIVAGDRVLYLPFDGDALDESGFDNHAGVNGAVLVDDRAGNANAAYWFDGVDDHLLVAGHPSLDFRDAATVALWIRPDALADRESFLISHGSWQNRWKLSVTPEKRLRWTVKTTTSIRDLDSETVPVEDSVLHVAATFGEGMMKLYVGGILDNEVEFGGTMAVTTIDLTVAQMLPGNIEWNFEGMIDDVQLYNRVLTESEIADLAGIPTAADGDALDDLPAKSGLRSVYPNPFSSQATVEFDLAMPADVTISVFDVTGRIVERLLSSELPAGGHRTVWNGRDAAGNPVAAGLYVVRFESDDVVRFLKLIRI